MRNASPNWWPTALGVRHHISTISTACSSGANALMYGSRLIRNNIVDVVIAGGTDALTRFTLNGFNTLMILDQQPCRPFDDTRTGLNLGEGAGYVVLVSDSLAAPDCSPGAGFSGFANANDAFSPNSFFAGWYRQLPGHERRAGYERIATTTEIGYINLHGTGTEQ